MQPYLVNIQTSASYFTHCIDSVEHGSKQTTYKYHGVYQWFIAYYTEKLIILEFMAVVLKLDAGGHE